MPTYTDQQILDAAREAMFNIVSGGGQSYSINGRTFSALNLKDLESLIAYYERRIARQTTPMMGVISFWSPR